MTFLYQNDIKLQSEKDLDLIMPTNSTILKKESRIKGMFVAKITQQAIDAAIEEETDAVDIYIFKDMVLMINYL